MTIVALQVALVFISVVGTLAIVGMVAFMIDEGQWK